MDRSEAGIPVPGRFNIGVACTDAHLDTPTAGLTAMVVEDDARGTDEVSYAGLAAATAAFAGLLQGLGIAPGERVLVRLPNSIAYPTAFLGAMKAGCIAVPTSTLLVAEEVRYLAEDSGARVLVTHRDMWPRLAPELTAVPGLEHVVLAGGVAPGAAVAGKALHGLEEALGHGPGTPVDTAADDPAYLVYTSGTTGRPKGVLHAHRALLGRLPAATHWFDFRPGDRVMHSGKFNWTYVLGTGLMDPLYHGQTVIVHEGANEPGLWPRLIARHGCTIFVGVPTIYRQIIQKTDCGAADVPTLRHCMCAGEHLSDEMLGAWRARFGQDIHEAIGMSEISYYISHNRRQPIRPGSAGFPQPGHRVALLDADLEPVADGEEGMLAVADDDPGLFLEYWGLPAETRAVRRGGWFLTGDYARRDADGYVWFLGRRDDIINTFGYRVSPHEVERVMKTHPAVADCVAIGEEVGPGKTLVAACVVARAGAAVDEEELLAWGAAHLAVYKCPRRIHLVADYPRTKNGKVVRSALKARIETAAGEAGP